MDLINATGETMHWWYNGERFDFPPNELVKVSDPCGQHMLVHLARKGLQEVRYGDDPNIISLNALRAIVDFHRLQVKAHDVQRKKAEDEKTPIPAEPEGYAEAKRALRVYEPILVEREKDEQARRDAADEKRIRSTLSKAPSTVDLGDMSIEELRKQVQDLGGEPKATTKAKLIRQVQRLQEQRESELASQEKARASEKED